MTVDAQDLSPQPSDNFSTMYPTSSSDPNGQFVEPHDIDHNSPYITFDFVTSGLSSCLMLSPTDTRGYITRHPLQCSFVDSPLYINQSFLVNTQAYTLVHILYRSNRTFTSSNFISFCTYDLSASTPLSIRQYSNFPFYYDFKHN